MEACIEGASNLQPVLHHAGVVSAQNLSTGERLCGGDANALAEELEPLSSPLTSSESRRSLDVISVCTRPGQHVG